MPFNQARQQPDDFTEADQLALQEGQKRASAACVRTNPSDLLSASTPAELLSLARLCLFGHQFLPAQKAALRYLQLDPSDDQKTAKTLLAQAFLGVGDTTNAADQAASLLRAFPYDADLHALVMQVVNTGSLREGDWSNLTRDLCQAEITNGFKQLDQGKDLHGQETTIPASQIYRDMLSCVSVLAVLHEEVSPDTSGRIRAVVTSPTWEQSAERTPMEQALARFDSEQKRSPVLELTGEQISKLGITSPKTIDLQHGSFLLVLSVLRSPGTLRVISEIGSAAPSLRIYLLTSWALNTGAEDQPTVHLAKDLKLLASQLPPNVSLLVIPDRILQRFHLDIFPAALAVRNGTLQVNTPLNGETSERMALIPLGAVKAPAPAIRRSSPETK